MFKKKPHVCPKCSASFERQRPTCEYRSELGKESLSLKCWHCRYEWKEPCADARHSERQPQVRQVRESQ